MAVDAIEMFRAKALSVSAISTLLGTRIYPQIAPSATAWPFVVVEIAKQEQPTHMTGRVDWLMPTLAVRIYAQTSASARAVADALRVGLHVFAGTVTVGIETINVGYLGLASEEDEAIMNNDGSAVAAYTIKQDWTATIAA